MQDQLKTSVDKDRLKILIVDDDEDLLFLLKDKLNQRNIECMTTVYAHDGLAKANQFQPNLVLLDLNLPKMSGFGFLRQFKQDQQLSNIPVIVLTSIEDSEVSREAMDLGAVGFLTKSCSDAELIAAIDEHTSH